MKKMFMLVAILIVGSLSACTDSQRGKVFSLGDNAKIECWSGDKLIYSGLSTGKVSSEQNSDGYHFVDKLTGKFMEVSGNCVITYNPEK